MKYVLAIYGEEGGMENATPEQMAEVMQAWNDYTESTREAGAFEGGEGLQPSATATTIRFPDGGGEAAVTDGPFAETKEQFGGFYLLECADLDEAIGWAKKIPVRGGAVEVRPVMVFDEDGAAAEAATAGAEA